MTWATVPLKRVATLRVSNVDKKTVEGEQPVRLCNYTDVYYGDTIRPDQEFMAATATRNQVEIFRLEAGDVIITKDSETANDIGVPAYVEEGAPDLICGYHLALIRPIEGAIDGRFLFWSMASADLRDQLASLATGVTRFGLRTDSIDRVLLPFPAPYQQRAIADFLDAETARIDRLIATERQLIDVARERLAAVIQSLVLGGEDCRIRGEEAEGPCFPITSDWQARPNRSFMREISDYSRRGDEELLTVSHLTGVKPRSNKDVSMIMAESTVGYKLVTREDLVINTLWAWMGALGFTSYAGIVSPAYGVYRLTKTDYDPRYFDALFRSRAYVTEMTRYSKGVWTSRLRLYPDSFLALVTPVPPPAEQRSIADSIEVLSGETSDLTGRLECSISLLQERRQALITAAVTGEFGIPGPA